MKKNKLLILVGSICLILALAVLPFMVACAEPAPGEPEFHWRFQCAFAPADKAYELETVQIARLIEEASGGRIKVDTYPAGAIVGPEEMFSATIDGAVEMGMNVSSAEAEIIPSVLCLSLPGSAGDINEHYDLMYKRGIFEIVQEGYREQGVHLLCSTLCGPILLRSRLSGVLDSWDAFKGTKGWATPVTLPTLTELGGVCVTVPGYDMYSAMKLGTIDWHEWTIAELETMSFKEVTKDLLIDPPTMMGAENVYVNLKAWEALGPELQKKIQDAVIGSLMNMALEYQGFNNEAIVAAEEYGVRIVEMSEADKATYIDLSVNFWDEIAAASPRCAQGVEISKAFLKSVGRL